MISNELTITVNGVESSSLDQEDALARAVIISLFTWRRAEPGDVIEGDKMGYWGDVAEPLVLNDKTGSRLWLLSREKVLPATMNRAREYAAEALQWLVEDGVASRVDVEVERYGLDGLAVTGRIIRDSGVPFEFRFDRAWEIIRAL